MMSKLIICIDGLGRDLISRENTPFLWKFGKGNYSAELETMFAFTGLEYSFFSGKTPRETGIWLEFIKSEDSIFRNLFLRFCLNKKLRNYFGVFLQKLNHRTWLSSLHNIPGDKLKYFDTCVKEGLWKLNFFENKKFVVYKWPFFATEKKQGFVMNYENDEKRLGRLLNVKDKEIYYTQLMEIDKVIHKFGKKSFETKSKIKKIDEVVEKYVKKFLRENKKGVVFLWSDHGFVDIKNYIDIMRILPKTKDYVYFIAGTTTHFWFKNKDIENKIRKILSSIKKLKILDEKSAKKYNIPFSRKYGDLIVFVEKGNYFFPNFYQKSLKERFVSMHGYVNGAELNGVLISNKKIPKKLKIYEVARFLR